MPSFFSLCYNVLHIILPCLAFYIVIFMFICRPFREWIPLASADPANPSSTTWYDYMMTVLYDDYTLVYHDMSVY